MIYAYFYLAIGVIVIAASYISYEHKEKDIYEVVHDKLHELRNDGSFSFQSANILGYLFAFTLGVLLWPALIIKKILGY
jgi:hypothetical protein